MLCKNKHQNYGICGFLCKISTGLWKKCVENFKQSVNLQQNKFINFMLKRYQKNNFRS